MGGARVAGLLVGGGWAGCRNVVHVFWNVALIVALARYVTGLGALCWGQCGDRLSGLWLCMLLLVTTVESLVLGCFGWRCWVSVQVGGAGVRCWS